ncbi:MAG: plastocyanin/azurin family copper-binding protein [Byssovorax sp.]
MNIKALLLGFSLAGLGALAACGDGGSTTSTTSTTTSTTTTTTTAGSGGSGGGTTTAGTGGSGGGTTTGSGGSGGMGGSGPMLVNGCDEATAEDHTADATVKIEFGGAIGLKYSPKCILIKPGTTVTFAGDFASHPLSGGLDGTKDPTSPITETTTGMTKDFAIPAAGTYGFFCEFHQASGMKGAIFAK